MLMFSAPIFKSRGALTIRIAPGFLNSMFLPYYKKMLGVAPIVYCY